LHAARVAAAWRRFAARASLGRARAVALRRNSHSRFWVARFLQQRRHVQPRPRMRRWHRGQHAVLDFSVAGVVENFFQWWKSIGTQLKNFSAVAILSRALLATRIVARAPIAHFGLFRSGQNRRSSLLATGAASP